MDERLKAHLYVLGANLIYGANYSIAKLVMPSLIQPFAFIILRVWISAVLFFLAWRTWSFEKVDKKDLRLLILCALFGVAMNQMLFFKGLSLTGPLNAGLIMVTNPIFVLVFGILFLGEAFTWKKTLGVASGLAGASVLILYSRGSVNTINSAAGDLCILLNSFSYAIFLVMVKPLMKKYHPLTIMTMVFIPGAVMVFPFGWNELIQVNWDQFTAESWSALAFVIIGTTFLAYLFNTLGLARLSPSVVSIYIYLQPLLAAGFAMLLGHQYPQWIHLLSAVLVFTGVYLCTGGSRKPVESQV